MFTSLATIGVASRTGIIYLPYIKKDYKKDIARYRPILILNLDRKLYTNSYESKAKNI